MFRAEGLAENFIKLPVRVNLAGFTAFLPELFRNGWKASIQSIREIDRDAIVYRLALNHDGIDQYAIADYAMTRHELYNLTSASVDSLRRIAELIVFETRHMASRIQCKVIPVNGAFFSKTFEPLTTGMMSVNSEFNGHKLEDIVRFEKAADSKDIFIPEKSIDELMGLILEKQENVQKDIRKRILDDRDRLQKGDSVLWTPKEVKTNLIVVGQN